METGSAGGDAGATHFSRRAFVGGGLAVVGASALPLPAFAASPAIPARRLIDIVSICTHPHWSGTVWQNSDWTTPFLETRVKHTRGKVGRGPSGKAAMVRLEKLFARGVRICATVADQDDGLDRVGTKANLDFLASAVGRQYLSGIEGPNEYNNPSSKPDNWAAELRDFQKWLRDTVRANPAFDGVPLVAPSIWGRLTWDYTAVGNLEPNVDRGCMHWYTGGRRPSIAGSPTLKSEVGGSKYYTMADGIREGKILAPTKPMVFTEFGYPIAGPNSALSGYIITETAAAKYILRGLLDAFKAGVQRISIYSLIDDVKQSKYFGLMSGSLARRKTFNALKNFMYLFADGSAAFTPQTLNYSLSNATSSIRNQIFQKTTGQFLLTLYQDVDSYDREGRRDAAVAPVSVGLTLGSPANIEVFAPTLSLSRTQSLTSSTRATIPVGDHVIVVRITPTSSGRIAAEDSGDTTASSATTQSTSDATAEPAPELPQPKKRDPFEFRVPPRKS